MKAWIAASLALALSACATGKAEVPYCVQRYTGGECNCDTGLFGNNHRFHYAYRFELESHLKHAQTIEISEHFPVSELDDVLRPDAAGRRPAYHPGDRP